VEEGMEKGKQNKGKSRNKNFDDLREVLDFYKEEETGRPYRENG
jgi:hypothetical protein